MDHPGNVEIPRFSAGNQIGIDQEGTRPWACVGAGYTFPAPALKPFLRLEVASALKHYASTFQSGPDDLNKALAPRLQVALYGGVRF